MHQLDSSLWMNIPGKSVRNQTSHAAVRKTLKEEFAAHIKTPLKAAPRSNACHAMILFGRTAKQGRLIPYSMHWPKCFKAIHLYRRADGNKVGLVRCSSPFQSASRPLPFTQFPQLVRFFHTTSSQSTCTHTYHCLFARGSSPSSHPPRRHLICK